MFTWSQGRYGRKEIPESLRRLDKIFKEKAKGSYVTEESFVFENPAGDTYDEDFPYAGSRGSHLSHWALGASMGCWRPRWCRETYPFYYQFVCW